jgi:uncharacterized protein (DUF779 family)
MNQIKITALAKDVVQQLQNRHGRLMFHISGGCCDGTQPQCYELGEFRLGEDIKLGMFVNVLFILLTISWLFGKTLN